MIELLSAVIVASAVAWAGWQVSRRRHTPAPAGDDRLVALLTLFAPGIEAVDKDPRALLTWQPLAAGARTLFPAEFDQLDGAFARTFPFSASQIQAAHSQWTTEWLAWERAHDAEFKLRSALLQQELGETFNTPTAKARLDAIEREKLDRYQQRYEQYVRVGKALQTLITPRA